MKLSLENACIAVGLSGCLIIVTGIVLLDPVIISVGSVIVILAGIVAFPILMGWFFRIKKPTIKTGFAKSRARIIKSSPDAVEVPDDGDV